MPQSDIAVGAPNATEKGDNNRSVSDQIIHAHMLAVRIRKAEMGSNVIFFDGSFHNTSQGELLDFVNKDVQNLLGRSLHKFKQEGVEFIFQTGRVLHFG